MRIKFLKMEFAVCKLRDLSRVSMASEYYFLSRTADEISLVCPADDAPADAVKVNRGWRAFRIEGQLDFSLVGILAELANLLAARGISIFAISTFDTDYVLIKEEAVEGARDALAVGGYEVV